MIGWPLLDGPAAPWSFLVATLGLGGLAAFATGRALALAWRPFALCLPAAALLAAVAGFLHYALFAEPVLPLARIASAVQALPADPVAGARALAGLLGNYAAIFVLLAAIAAGGFLRARARCLRERYGFD
jgi:hypothetical protein